MNKKTTSLKSGVQWIFMLCLAITACRKPVNVPHEFKPAVRPAGTTLGAVISKQIGPDGGSIKSDDGALEITIPPGALTTLTPIRIQPIVNTNLAGIDTAYRLAPHGLQFAKPVDITFSYAGLEDSIQSLKTLDLSFQNDKGVWICMRKSVVNTTTKTVTYKSTHFSDWGLMRWLILEPKNATLRENGEVTLMARTYIDMTGQELYVPLEVDGYPVGPSDPIPPAYIAGWGLAGPGELFPVTAHSQAIYRAPSAIFPYTVAASIKLKSVKLTDSLDNTQLVSNIELLSGDFFEMKIGNGDWTRYAAKALVGEEFGVQRATVEYISPNLDTTIQVIWAPKNGSYATTTGWGKDDNQKLNASFRIFYNGGQSIYTDYYQPDPNNSSTKTSGGTLKVTQFGTKKGDPVEGEFSLTSAGYWINQGRKYVDAKKIEGRFNMRRQN